MFLLFINIRDKGQSPQLSEAKAREQQKRTGPSSGWILSMHILSLFTTLFLLLLTVPHHFMSKNFLFVSAPSFPAASIL